MKKFFILVAFAGLLGSSSAFAWGNPYLTPQQNYKNYMACLNTAKNGAERQKILANWACETYYGVTTWVDGGKG
ncbi:hypothetical protein DMB92_07505 [Campylobacter sp. MIT 99-7217]|uniref:hypothetical protein n=1 Tax=Campylobacter sp. MIT 99-7217 TaxID=535091 RepID=UPI00115BCA3D|nr:hypothetical protein [Campylobacter sp. MIT 99-7217]TQR30655.1 hypothetical protein DMB92_07505 [Campylobacter sp. MIT 99-7217]